MSQPAEKAVVMETIQRPSTIQHASSNGSSNRFYSPLY